MIIKFLCGVAFIGSIAWFIAQPNYEPAIAIVTSLIAFIAAWVGDKKIKRRENQIQTIAKNGIGIQAGGDVKMGDIRAGRESTDAE